MSFALIILGVFLALVGLGAIAAGAPSWALGLGLGSALIQSGSMGLVGGFLLVGIGFVLRSLRDLSHKIEMAAIGGIEANPASARMRVQKPAAVRTTSRREPAPSRREPSHLPAREERDDQTEDEYAARVPDDYAARAPNDYAAPQERSSARTVLPSAEPRISTRQYPTYTETRRREREREHPRFSTDRPAPPVSDDSFEEPESLSHARVAATDVSTLIVRSGIISGMAYTLYKDGSIEAELPIGTVRFASIEELQNHVSATGDEADVDFGESKSRTS
jgi:hypothetical protein